MLLSFGARIADHRVSFILCGGYVSNVMAVLLYNTTNFSRLILLVGGVRGHPKELLNRSISAL
jgi:hypothetical protein